MRPYQPDGLYKDMLFSNMTNYAQDKGDGLWRRSLYTFWKRTVDAAGDAGLRRLLAANPAPCARRAPTRRCRR